MTAMHKDKTNKVKNLPAKKTLPIYENRTNQSPQSAEMI